MERLLETFEMPFVDGDGTVYDVQLYGRDRPGDTWEARLIFIRRPDGIRFVTPTETTQPSAEAVRYWATGLTSAYFDGAFQRARWPTVRPPRTDVATDLEQVILNLFQRCSATQLATRTVLDELPHAHADVIRALQDLQRQRHLLVRKTDGGHDWLILTEAGIRAASG